MKIKTYRYYTYYAMLIGIFLVKFLPVRIIPFLGALGGSAAFIFAGKERAQTIENLKRAFPEKSLKEIRGMARNVFRNITSNFLELPHMWKLTEKNINERVLESGFEKFKDIFKRGKGVLLLTAHFGNWEMVGAYLGLKGIEPTTIAKKVYFHKYESLLRKFRDTYKLLTIDRDSSPKIMLKLLKNNKLLGILADQDIASIDGIFVDFFGKPAYTPTAPVKMAMASGAPILPCFVVRTGSKYRCLIDDPIYVEKGAQKKEEIVKKYTKKWTTILESYIRKYPDQWVWMHKRWKTKQKDKT